MSAPVHEAPAAEQSTQPLPVPQQSTIHCRQSGPGVWAVPVTVLAAVGAGELIRDYILVTEVARSNFAIVVLLLVLVLAVAAMVCGRLVNSRDGRGRS